MPGSAILLNPSLHLPHSCSGGSSVLRTCLVGFHVRSEPRSPSREYRAPPRRYHPVVEDSISRAPAEQFSHPPLRESLMAQLVIFGGTGYSGSNIAREALTRGHSVISYARHAPTEPIDGVEYRIGSITDPIAVKQAETDADALGIALPAYATDG